MRLMVVYGLKTRDYNWLTDFYPARRLKETCENRSIPLRFLFPRDIPAFLEDRHGPETPQSTVCLIRGKVSVPEIRCLEEAGYRCVNSAASRNAADDKLETRRFLARHGWPTPQTRPFSGETGSFDAPEFPFVLKPRFGSRGTGVTLIENEADFESWRAQYRESGFFDADEWIVQEYIETSRGRDLRVFFAGGDILAAVERQGESGSFLSNASTGGITSFPSFGPELPEPWKSMVLDIARETGLWYGTVDFLFTRSGKTAENGFGALTICEINSAPGFEALETQCGLDIAGMIIDSLIRDFNCKI